MRSFVFVFVFLFKFLLISLQILFIFEFQFDMDPLNRCLAADQCCCCLNLRRGGIVLGCVCIFFALSGLLAFRIWPREYIEHYSTIHIPPESALFSSCMYHFSGRFFIFLFFIFTQKFPKQIFFSQNLYFFHFYII